MTGVGTWSRASALELAAASGYEPLDLSLGVPADPQPDPARFGLTTPTVVASYPASAGSAEFRSAAKEYLSRRYGVTVPMDAVAACVGAKEFIGTLPSFLRGVRGASRDTVLVPSLGYRSYTFGAGLAGLRVHRVPVDSDQRMRLDLVPPQVAERALVLWVNSPNNPTGRVEPLERIAAWGREHGVIVCSDEAYAEMTWCHEPRTVLRAGPDGVLAVHSVSKRSNAPGLRAAFYAGDPALVDALVAVRRDAGLMVPAASQEFAARLLDDDRHAERQRTRNQTRVFGLVRVLREHGLRCTRPDGGFFAWVEAPEQDGVAFARELAARAGLVVAAGLDYGPTGAGHVRIAAVRDPDEIGDRLALLDRLTAATPGKKGCDR